MTETVVAQQMKMLPIKVSHKSVYGTNSQCRCILNLIKFYFPGNSSTRLMTGLTPKRNVLFRDMKMFSKHRSDTISITSLSSNQNGLLKLKNFKISFKQKRYCINEEHPHRQFFKRDLVKPYMFATIVTMSTFFAAFIYSYEKWRSIFKQLHKGTYKHEKYNGSIDFKDLWNSTTRGEKLIIGIIAINTCVFGLWRVKLLQPFMNQYFVLSLGNPASSMLGACFSHIKAFHILMNMYVLWSFGPTLAHHLGEEQVAAVYISAGIMSALSGLTVSTILRRPYGSVGASGCIMGLLGLFGTMYPDNQLCIAFVDKIIPHSFSAQYGVMGIMAVDILGLFLGWRFFDHAGHLGGVIFGLLYAKYGQHFIWGTARKSTLKNYKDLRDPK